MNAGWRKLIVAAVSTQHAATRPDRARCIMQRQRRRVICTEYGCNNIMAAAPKQVIEGARERRHVEVALDGDAA